MLALNLVRREWDLIDTKLAHEYTHVAQNGAGADGEFPIWFIEGQAAFQEDRNGKPRFDYMGTATSDQRKGTAPRLADIATHEGWHARERSDGSMPVYSRGYAAIAYLAQRYGFPATAQLLRDNRDGDLDQFNVLLARLTGVDLNGFDDAVGAWLLAGAKVTAQPPAPRTTATACRGAAPAGARYVGTDNRGLLSVQFTTSADGTVAQGTIVFDREAPCGNGRVVRAGVTVTFILEVRADGVFTGNGSLGSALLTLDGRFFSPSDVRGALRYNNAATTGCDTGPLAFAARPA